MAFKGQIVRVSELIADVLTGAVIQTATSGTRLLLSPIFGAMVQFFTGAANEAISGRITGIDEGFGGGNHDLTLHIHSPGANDPNRIAQAILRSFETPAPYATEIELNADHVKSSADEWDITSPVVNIIGELAIGTSQPITGFDFGVAVVTSNALGQVTINHNIGIAPAFADAIYQPSVTTTQKRIYKLQAKTAISITFEIWRVDLGALEANGVAHTLSWFAVG